MTAAIIPWPIIPRPIPRTELERFFRQRSTAMQLMLRDEAALRKLDADWLREFDAETADRLRETY